MRAMKRLRMTTTRANFSPARGQGRRTSHVAEFARLSTSSLSEQSRKVVQFREVFWQRERFLPGSSRGRFGEAKAFRGTEEFPSSPERIVFHVFFRRNSISKREQEDATQLDFVFAEAVFG